MEATVATSTLEDFWFGQGADETTDEAASKSVAALVAHVHGVKPLPVAAQKLMRAGRDPKTSVETLARILESDAGLLARVLRLVNSAIYGLRVQCKSARSAVTLLGPQRIAEVAAASAVLELFDNATIEATHLLEHTLAIAAIMKRLAQKCGQSVEDAFTCGLLHDIGKLMQLQVGDDTYTALLAAEGSSYTIHLREREIYGFDHGILAGHMLRTWNIPSPVPEAIGLHHHMARAYGAGGNVAQMVHLLHISELLAEAVTGPRADDEDLDAIVQDESATFLNLTRDDFVSIWSDVDEAIRSSKTLLGGGTADEDAAGEEGDRPSGVRRTAPPPTQIGIDPFGDDGPRLPRYPRAKIAAGVAVAAAVIAAAAAIFASVH